MTQLSDAQELSVAQALRGHASAINAQADLLDPPATTPTVPGEGGTVVTPDGFVGRTAPSAEFNQTPAFEDNFPNLAAEGEFLSKYLLWSAYPTNYTSTDKKGIYDPSNLSVADVDGLRVLHQKVKPGKNGGKPSGCTPQARWGANGDGRTKGECVQGRFKLAKTGPGGHFVPLGWPPKDSDWPVDGEPDYVEIDTNAGAKVVGWFHVQNGCSQGGGQVQLVSDVSAEEWFVVKAERIPGKSYRWYVNGKLYKQILAPGLKPTDAEKAVTTVLAGNYNIALNYLRWPIQFESKGTAQTGEIVVLCDWWSIYTLKA